MNMRAAALIAAFKEARTIAAAVEGVRAAVDRAIVVDDGSTDGTGSSLLAEAATSGADVVIGERRFQRSRMPASRYHANRIGSRVLSWFVGIPVQDTQCGFRVFRVDALRPLRLRATGYEIETEMLVKVRRRGGRVAAVPITAVYDGQRSKL